MTEQQDRLVTPSFPQRQTLASPTEDLGGQPRAVFTRPSGPDLQRKTTGSLSSGKSNGLKSSTFNPDSAAERPERRAGEAGQGEQRWAEGMWMCADAARRRARGFVDGWRAF